MGLEFYKNKFIVVFIKTDLLKYRTANVMLYLMNGQMFFLQIVLEQFEKWSLQTNRNTECKVEASRTHSACFWF